MKASLTLPPCCTGDGPAKRQRASHPGQGYSRCKGPEVGMTCTCLRTRRKPGGDGNVAGKASKVQIKAWRGSQCSGKPGRDFKLELLTLLWRHPKGQAVASSHTGKLVPCVGAHSVGSSDGISPAKP